MGLAEADEKLSEAAMMHWRGYTSARLRIAPSMLSCSFGRYDCAVAWEAVTQSVHGR
mgnify:CR=1 FL=1